MAEILESENIRMKEIKSPSRETVRPLTFPRICFVLVLGASPGLCSPAAITEDVLPEQTTVPQRNTPAANVKAFLPPLPLEGASPDGGTCVLERKCRLPFVWITEK